MKLPIACIVSPSMIHLLLWFLLLVICWPLALILLILSPILWLVLLPFRLLGMVVEGVFELIRAVFLFPSRILKGRAR